MTEAADSADAARATGIHLNGATIMTTPTDVHVRIARDTGYAGVEVRAERLLVDAAETRAAAALVRPGEVWSLNGIQIQLAPDGTLERERLDDELVPRLGICRDVGAAFLLIVPPRMDQVSRPAAVAGVRDGVRRIQDAAARDGVGVAFEFLGFGDCPIDSPSLAGEVVHGLDDVALVIDSCHWHASGSGPLDAFPVERLAMVHLNDAPPKPPREVEDADRLLPGRGVIRLTELVAALRDRGYRGPWSLETFNPDYWAMDPSSVASEGQEALRPVLGSGG
jgi:2-keto-myo-inositol isomerase